MAITEKIFIFAGIKLNTNKTVETAVMDYYNTKVRLIEGFTPRQRAEFEKGISIENYAREKGIRI